MVPVTREDALLDAPFAQWEPHVGTAVVERKYFPLMRAKQQRAILTSHRHHLLFLQFGERCGAKKFSEIKGSVSGTHNKKNENPIDKSRKGSLCKVVSIWEKIRRNQFEKLRKGIGSVSEDEHAPFTGSHRLA